MSYVCLKCHKCQIPGQANCLVLPIGADAHDLETNLLDTFKHPSSTLDSALLEKHSQMGFHNTFVCQKLLLSVLPNIVVETVRLQFMLNYK